VSKACRQGRAGDAGRHSTLAPHATYLLDLARDCQEVGDALALDAFLPVHLGRHHFLPEVVPQAERQPLDPARAPHVAPPSGPAPLPVRTGRPRTGRRLGPRRTERDGRAGRAGRVAFFFCLVVVMGGVVFMLTLMLGAGLVEAELVAELLQLGRGRVDRVVGPGGVVQPELYRSRWRWAVWRRG